MARLTKWLGFEKRPRVPFRSLFARFRQLIDNNTRVLQLFADAAEKQSGEYVFDRTYVVSVVDQLFDLANKIVYDLNSIADQKYAALYAVVDRLRTEVLGDLAGRPVVPRTHICIPFRQIDESRVNLVGGKSAHLGEVATRLQVPIPVGFAITTHAYLRVVEENNLAPLIETALERLEAGDGGTCETICERLRQAKIPRDVRRAVSAAIGDLGVPGQPLHFAVRSSALGEDDELSFAGQYRTVLQVPAEGVLDAYREVLASLYSKEVVAYRQARKLSAFGLMAVACMRMVRATTAGMLQTADPNQPENQRMLLGVTRGLANRAASGEWRLSTYELSRDPPHAVLAYRPAKNTEMVVGRPEGGVTEVVVKPEHGDGPELTPLEAQALAHIGLRIERYFKQAQELEWARDADGTLYVLQTRRLQVAGTAGPRTNLPEILERHRILMQGQGYVACRGVSYGRVQRLGDPTDVSAVSSGVVLVARRGSPRFVRVMPRVAAILTDIGAPTGHMAALAREFRVPTVVDCGDVTRRLEDGQEVTVDAGDNVVYEGRVEALLQHQLLEETDFEDAVEYRLLRRLLRRVTPLQLVDPHSDDFRAERCRTVHDVIRFAHEKAVEVLIGLHAKGKVMGAESARRIDSELPLNLRLIDIGKGLDAAVASLPAGASIKPESLRSAPMVALWKGLSTPGVWNTQPVGVNWRTFMASATSATVGRNTGRNLAVVSDSYVNLSLNLGYHYNMVDAFLCDDREANHVYFRFVGGAADNERRTRRAMVVREILEQLDFSARQSGDLVVARLRKLPRGETESRLEAIGRLIGFARQIDALMDSDATAAHFVEAFFRGDYTFEQ